MNHSGIFYDSQLSNQLIFGLLSAFLLNSVVIILFRFWIKGHVLLNVVALFYWLQICWVIGSCVLSGSSELIINISTNQSIDLRDAPWRVPFALSIMPVIAFLCAATIPSGLKDSHRTRFFSQKQHKALKIILYIFSFGPVYFILSVKVFDGLIFGALLQYLYLSLFMTPVLMGIYWRLYRRPVVVFIINTLIAAFFAFSEGSRTLMFMPIMFFLFGVWLSLKLKNRILMLTAGLMGVIPIFYLSAIVENVRPNIRNFTDIGYVQKISMMFGAISEQNNSTNNKSLEIIRGVNRMIMSCNQAVLVMTPQLIPYRGFGNFLDEIKYTNTSTLGPDGKNLAEIQFEHEVGPGAANIYGFGACVGGAVPFSVIADGWSRAGLIGAAGFSLVLCLMWGSIEFFARRLLSQNPYFIPAFLAIFAFSPFERASIYPFVYNLRYLIMQLIIWTIVFYAVSRGAPAKRKHPQLYA